MASIRRVAFLLLALVLASSVQAFQIRYSSTGAVLADYGKATAVRYPSVVQPAATGAATAGVVGGTAFVTNSGGVAALGASAAITKPNLWGAILAGGSAAGMAMGSPAAMVLFGAVGLANYLADSGYTYDPFGDPDKANNPGRVFSGRVNNTTQVQACYGIVGYNGGVCPNTGNVLIPASSMRWGMTKQETCTAWAASANSWATLTGNGTTCTYSTGYVATITTTTRTVEISNTAYYTPEQVSAAMQQQPTWPTPAEMDAIMKASPTGITTTVPAFTGPQVVFGSPTVTVTQRTEMVLDPVSGLMVPKTITTTTTKVKRTELTYTDGTPTQTDTETTSTTETTSIPTLTPQGQPVLNPDGSPKTTTTTGTTETTSTGTPKTPEEDKGDLCALHPEILACQGLGTPPTAETLQNTDRGSPVTIDTGFGPSTASCPSPAAINVMGRSVEMSYQPYCDFASGIRPVVLALAFLAAAFTVLGMRKAGE